VLPILWAIYLIGHKRLEKSLTKFIIQLIMSLLFFSTVFVIGTLACYYSGLFDISSSQETPAMGVMINSAFYEISALSTVGLMPNYTAHGENIYSNTGAYLALASSMLIGRLFDILYPFFILTLFFREGS
jgi:hypothetical protein